MKQSAAEFYAELVGAPPPPCPPPPPPPLPSHAALEDGTATILPQMVGPANVDSSFLQARRALTRGFRTGGVIHTHLDPPVTRQEAEATKTPRHAPKRKAPFGEPAESQHVDYGVGRRLLERAGWKEGQGLGTEAQGRAAPLEAAANPGRRGIGAVVKDKATRVAPSTSPVTRQQARAALTTNVEVKEDAETKLARHKQINKQQEEQERHRAISRYMSRAFRNDEDENHPLLRPNRLTRSNPLLHSNDD